MTQPEFTPVKIIAKARKLPSRLPKYQQEQVKKLIAKKLRSYEIAKKVGVSRSEVIALMS
jgi:hypothetical protein